MARLRRCHGCGAQFQNRKGADLHCSDECAGQHQAAQTMFQESLTQAGFVQVAERAELVGERRSAYFDGTGDA
jgi:hypothetical protein